MVTSDATIGHFNLYQPGGGFMCICPEGMKWNEWKRACEDVNECQEMTDPCYRQSFSNMICSAFELWRYRANLKYKYRNL